MKSAILLITGLFIVFALYYIYSQGGETEKAKAEVKCQEKEIIIYKEVIKDAKKVQERKVKNLSIPSSDNIEWLFNNPRCKTCNN